MRAQRMRCYFTRPSCFRRTVFLRALIAVLAAFVFLACERPQERPATQAVLAVRDGAGRDVKLAAPATRVVSLLPSVTDLIVAMGQQHRLIARTDYDLDARLAGLPSIGGGLTPSVEWLAARKPDLIVSWPDNSTRSLVGKFDALRIPVYSVRMDTIANTFETIRDLGILFNAATAADSLARVIATSLDSVRNAVRGLERTRAAYLVSIAPPTAVGPHTFIDEILRIAGGDNAFADLKKPYAEISLEDLLLRDPEVLIVSGKSGRDLRAQLSAMPAWRDLRAVRSRHVYRVPADTFNRSGPLMPEAARMLAAIFSRAR